MAKKIAGQAGGLVSAPLRVDGISSASDYTQSLKELQEEISGKFQSKKVMSMRLASVYQLLSLYGRASRVAACGSELQFGLLSDGSKKLIRANFCRDRLCPMCNWRRSLKVFSQVSQCMDELEKQGYSFLFLTLTVRNCSAEEFPATVDALLSGWKSLYNHSRPVLRVCFGSFRSLEVTVNHKQNTYHPHLHVVLAVKPDYFTGPDYLSQRAWSDLWRSACGLSYNPIVHIQKLTEYSQGFKEVCKYSVKGSDYLVGDSDKILHHVKTFLSGLSGRRLCGFTGCFSKVRKALALDDPETGDLVVTDGQTLRSDLYAMIVRYQWRCGVYVRL